jgi:hypothetical protein
MIKLPNPVKGQYFESIENVQIPGAFSYWTDSSGTIRGMMYRCPCGCTRLGGLAFNPPTEDDLKYSRATWNWNQNKEAPTLTPSIHHVGHWHGFLTNGIWVQA